MKSRQDFVPVYYQLADDLKQQIESGKLKPGDIIPSESQLGAAYNISRMTVRRGLALLIESGLIETVKGKGNFVAEPRLDQLVIDFQENKTFNDRLKEDNLQFKLVEVKLVGADLETADRLGIPEGKRLFQMQRLLTGRDGPVALDIKYLPYIKGSPLLEKEIEYADFPRLVASHTQSLISKIEMAITAVTLTPEEGSMLESNPGSPALCIDQTIYSRENKPLGISRMVCRADRYLLKAVSYPYSGR